MELRHYWWRRRASWLGLLLSVAGSVACTLGVSRALGTAIDDLRVGGAHLARNVLTMIGLAVLAALFLVLTRRTGVVAARHVADDIRCDLFGHVSRMEAAYFHEVHTGDLVTRIMRDVTTVQDMLGYATVHAVTAVLTLGFSFLFMLEVSVRLGLMVFGLFPVILVVVVMWRRAVTVRTLAVQAQQSKLAARVQESFSGVRLVKGYALEDRELAAFEAANVELLHRALSLQRSDGALTASMGVFTSLVFVLLLVRGTLLIPDDNAMVGDVSLGGFVSFIGYLLQLSWPLLAIGVTASLIQKGLASWKRVREVFRTEPRMTSKGDAPPAELRGEIRFEDVSLIASGRVLLSSINLIVAPGSVVGITGATGAGKSLLASLVPRITDPTSGVVRIDGRDVREWPLDALRAGIGVVTQEPFLFSTTIAENVALGLETTDRATVDHAVSIAGLEPDLTGFPAGLETRVGERGVTLSGGQRQRTALARALAKRSPLLIIDDALSALDTETEARVLQRLRRELAGRTVLLISHRVSTLRRTDEIIVLDAGKVAERGTHEMLIAFGGLYAELARKQRTTRLVTEA
jgi:ATP-binding cassette subfamily B multidrug efflux pump